MYNDTVYCIITPFACIQERRLAEAERARMAAQIAEQQRVEQQRAEAERLERERQLAAEQKERERQAERERLEALQLPSTAQWASNNQKLQGMLQDNAKTLSSLHNIIRTVNNSNNTSSL